MFSFLRRSGRAHGSTTPRFFRPQLEPLEDRLSPSGAEMLLMNVTYAPNKEVTLSGGLYSLGGPVANQAINFGGVVDGTTATNALGLYSVTLPVSQLGAVTAASADGLSNTVLTNLVSAVPTIARFAAISEGNGFWMLAGQVSGAPTQGEVIQFDGLAALDGQSCNVNPDGTFSYVVYVPSGQGGIATADAVDWWGDTSNSVQTTVAA